MALPQQYYSIHTAPITRFDSNGVPFVTKGFKDNYDFIDNPLIAASLNITVPPAVNDMTGMEWGNSLLYTINWCKGATIPEQALVKVWIPAGTIAMPLSVFCTQQAKTQFIAKFDSPPTSTFPFDVNTTPSDSRLSRLEQGLEVVGCNAAGGGSFQFSYFGDTFSKPLSTGRWLYMQWWLPDNGYDGSGGQQCMARVNGSIGFHNIPFQDEYKHLLWDVEGNPNGTSANNTLDISLQVKCEDVGKSATFFTVLICNGVAYFLTKYGAIQYVQVAGKYYNSVGTLSTNQKLTIDKNLLSQFNGKSYQIWTGYGFGDSFTNPILPVKNDVDSFSNMVINGTYSLVFNNN